MKWPQWHDIDISSFMKMGTDIKAILRFFLKKSEAGILVLLMGRNLLCMPLRWLYVA
jgi:hypothetical protein